MQMNLDAAASAGRLPTLAELCAYQPAEDIDSSWSKTRVAIGCKSAASLVEDVEPTVTTVETAVTTTVTTVTSTIETYVTETMEDLLANATVILTEVMTTLSDLAGGDAEATTSGPQNATFTGGNSTIARCPEGQGLVECQLSGLETWEIAAIATAGLAASMTLICAAS